MKIGLSTTVMQHGRSGVGRYVQALTRAFLPQAGRHEFFLFALEEDRPLLPPAGGAVRIVTVPERCRRPLADIAWHQTVLPRLARQLGLDVLHVPSYRRMLWRRPCPLVATIHDLAPFHLAGKYDPARMFYGRVVARRLAHRQDAVIAVSETTARDLRRHFRLPAERLSVVRNGLDHDRFRPGPAAAARARVAQPRGIRRPFFLYLARLEHPGKNHLRLIEAFARFERATGSDWELVLGGSDWTGAAAIHQAADRSPFAAAIHRPGFVPESDLPDWYRAAEVFVYPSLFEGFGLPPLEAMACGCPVISSPAGGLEEVTAGAAAPIAPEEFESIAAQLIRLSADSAERDRLRTAGLARARLYDWGQCAAGTLAAYSRAGRFKPPPLFVGPPAAAPQPPP